MQCINCSGQIVTINGDLELQDKILGEFIVYDTEFDQCEDCGEKLYSSITLKAIEEAEAKRKKELLLEKSLNSFITATEVAKILGCTRQAVHKHKVINILGEPVVFEAIAKLLQIEKEKCLKKICRLKSELIQYEKQFSISSKEAWTEYQKGALGDDFDVMEWMALFQNFMSFQEQYDRMTEFNF